jgi:hypothetical protein
MRATGAREKRIVRRERVLRACEGVSRRMDGPGGLPLKVALSCLGPLDRIHRVSVRCNCGSPFRHAGVSGSEDGVGLSCPVPRDLTLKESAFASHPTNDSVRQSGI